jgi:hypothetical protein
MSRLTFSEMVGSLKENVRVTLLCIGPHKTSTFFVLVGAFQHHSHAGLLYSYAALNEFRHSTPEALHTKRRKRPLLAKDGTKSK